MKKKAGIGSKITLALTLLFFYLPIFYIILFSFNDSRSLTKFGGFSLRWYEKMFSASAMMEAVFYTVVIGLDPCGRVNIVPGTGFTGCYGTFDKSCSLIDKWSCRIVGYGNTN